MCSARLQGVCVRTHAGGCEHVYPCLSLPVQGWGWTWPCASVCRMRAHTQAQRTRIGRVNPRTTSFGTHQFVTCEKRQSEDCKWAGHSSQVRPWDSVTPVITAYSEDLLHTTSSLALPTNGGRGWIYGSPFYLFFILVARLAGTEQAESRVERRERDGGMRKVCPVCVCPSDERATLALWLSLAFPPDCILGTKRLCVGWAAWEDGPHQSSFHLGPRLIFFF